MFVVFFGCREDSKKNRQSRFFTKKTAGRKQSQNTINFFGLQCLCGMWMEKFCFRECWEEIGIPREQVDVWGTLPSLSSSHRGDHAAVPVIGLIQDFHPEQLNINHDEVEEVFCVKFSKLSDPAVYGYTQFRVEVSPFF